MNSPQLLKFSSLTLHFQSLHLPSSEVEKTSTAAVWGSPQQKQPSQGEDGESTIAMGLNSCVMRHNKPLLIAGDPDEYAAELEELVLSHVYGRHNGGGFGGASELPTKILRLLGFIEDPEKFLKFLRRDFSAYFPASGEVTVARPGDGADHRVVDLSMDVAELSSFDVLKACISGLESAAMLKKKSASKEQHKRKRDDRDATLEAGAPQVKYGTDAT